MSGIIYRAGAGAILQQMRLDAYSNNLANVGTVGFKSDQPVFRFHKPEVEPDVEDGPAPRITPYAPNLEYVTNFAPGPIQKTGNTLDVAIVGKGFFEIQTAEGPQYSRNGRFSINEAGVLTNSDGWPVMGSGGEITIDGSRVEFSDNGEIAVDGEIVDALRVVDFQEPYNLKKADNGNFIPGAEDILAQEVENATISQGSVETSNVNAIRTMTQMIELLRVFQSYQKVIRAADDTTAKTINEVGKPV